MLLEVGSKIGAYEITSRLGEGGMGVVFRARDSKLGRDVAIKALPEAFATDQDRLQRFLREAQALAALNHSNIAQIYGLEDSTQPPCIVMELVQGETLADRLQRGPIPVSEALPMAKQIVEALEAAHEKGIVHRDLKPGNVMVLPDGGIKVLDFGLAKVHEDQSAGLSNSPTMMSASMPGSILGTAAYMAPEQAKGLNADSRSDLFSFGCILFEMLTGRRAFDGDTASEIMAAVIKTEPDLGLLPTNVNRAIRKLLQRCLEKNPKNRWHAAADIRLELQASMTGSLEESPATPARPPHPAWPRVALLVLAMAVSAALGAIAVWRSRPVSTPLPVVRLSVIVPEDQLLNLTNRPFALSPDGTQMVYFVKGQLYRRLISELEAKPIAGTEDSIASAPPVFSPDGASIAYVSFSTRTLRKISINGGNPVTLAPIDRLGIGGMEWTADGILFSQGYSEILKVSENGGEPKSLVKTQGSERIGMPHMLPGGKALLFSIADPRKRPGADCRSEPGYFPAQSLDGFGNPGYWRQLCGCSVFADRAYRLRSRRNAIRRAVRSRAASDGIQSCTGRSRRSNVGWTRTSDKHLQNRFASLHARTDRGIGFVFSRVCRPRRHSGRPETSAGTLPDPSRIAGRQANRIWSR